MESFAAQVLFAASLILGRCGASLAATTEPPKFSVTRLQISGATGRDKLTASFYVLAGKDGAKGLHLLPGDLIAQDIAVIAAASYQVTPATVPTLDAGQALLVKLEVGPIPASGTYKGSIRLLYQGMAAGTTLELPIELKASPKTNLEVAAHPNPLRLRVTRAILPSWLGGSPSSEPVEFTVRQKSDGPGRVHITQTGPLDGAADAVPLPDNALSVVRLATASPGRAIGAGEKQTEYELAAGEWTTLRVALRTADLNPGTYKAAFALSGAWDSVQTLPLEVVVRDPWPYPLLALLLGFLLSFAVTFMATTGSALLLVWRGIDALRQRLARPWLLPTDNVADWERRLNMLDEQSGQMSQPQAKATLDAIANEIDQARTDSEARLKTISNRLSDLDQVGVLMAGSPAIAPVRESPWVAGLTDRLAALARDIQYGKLSRGVVSARLWQDDEQVALLVNVARILPSVTNQADIQSLVSGNWLGSIKGPTDAHWVTLIDALKSKNLWPVPAPHAMVAQPEPRENEDGNSDRTAPVGLFEKLAAWVKDPRHFVPALSSLLSLLALALLAATGLLTLYSGKPNFGSNWPVDYLGLFVWGLGSEAGRKQVGDLAPLLGTLRTRLGVSAPPS